MPGGAFLLACPPDDAPAFEAVELGLATVLLATSNTEAIPRRPQSSNAS